MTTLPTLDGFGPTRATLHNYAKAINVLARVHADPKPHWWHTGLTVLPAGLVSDLLPLPDGSEATFLMDLHQHQIVMSVDGNPHHVFPMNQGWSGTQMGEVLIEAAAELGLHGQYDRARFASDEPGHYDIDGVKRFFTALTTANIYFKQHQASLSGDASPVHFWPHNFDLSAEWYSTKRVPFEENGRIEQLPAQLNLGFYPGDNSADSYFYSSPWPFAADRLMSQPMPEGVLWHTEGWEGAKLPYGLLLNDAQATDRLAGFAQAIFAIASPTLTS